MTAFLAALRRRLRWVWATATAQWAAPAVALVALALVAVGRVRPWAWPEPGAAAVVVGSLVVLGVAALAIRIPTALVARAADRGLSTKDAFASALEVDEGHPFHDSVVARAERVAFGRKPAEAAPVAVRRRRLLVAVLVLAGAAGLAFAPNHQDDVRTRLAIEKQAVKNEAARLKKLAERIAKDPRSSAEEREVAKKLDSLARELAKTASLSKAQQAIDKAAGDLASRIDGNVLSQKAAVKGLDRSVQASPLAAGLSGGAAEQLAALAKQLGQLTPEQRAALAARLSAMAKAQAAGNPEASAALSDAAAALSAGDLAAAASALSAASAAQQGAAGSVRSQEAAAGGVAALGESQGRLSQAGQGQQGQGEGQQGQGQGQGEGQQGQGQGEGQGQGQGEGQGQGQGGQGGSASGKVGGASGAGGQGGQGGQGTPDGSGHNPSTELATNNIFAPGPEGTGEDSYVSGMQGEGPSETEGKGDGPTTLGDGFVPYQSVLGEYQAQATRALDQLDIAPSLRALVRAYFAGLAEESQ